MPKPADTTVLQQILDNPKFAEFNPTLIEEAYEVMSELAPRLALITAIAGHWVRGVLHTGFIDVGTVKQLCDAELAYTETNQMGFARNLAQDAFFGGATWAMKQAVAAEKEPVHEGFEQWWGQSEDDEDPKEE